MITDNRIIQQLKQGDEQGFTALLDRYAPYVSTIVCNFSRGALSREDVEEISADVFLSIWNASSRLRFDAPLKPYLAAAARNAAISRLRKSRPDAVPFDDDILLASREGNPDELAAAREQEEIINEAVESFGEPDRELFIRRYYFGERIKAIAQRLSLNPDTAKTKLRRCRDKLRTILKERGYSLEEEA